MMGLKNIFTNTAAQVASRVLSSGSGFLVTVLIARYFGLAGYSDIAKITALVSLFYLGIDLGANALFLQFEEHEQRLQDLLSFRLFLAGVLFVVLAAITLLLPYNAASTSGYSPLVKMGIILFAFSFFSRAVVLSTAAVFQQKLVYPRATVASLASAVVTVGMTVFAVAVQLPLLWVIGAYVAGGFVEGAVSLFFVREQLLLIRPSLVLLGKLFWQTLPLTLLLFLNLLYFRMDMVLLTFMKQASAVGLYDYAYKFFDFLIALPLFLSNTLYPSLLLQEKNSRIQRKNISLYMLRFFLLGIMLVPVVWLASPLIVLVKQDFAPSVLVLRILSFSLPIFFATSILQWIFIAKKQQRLLVAVYGGSLIFNIILNLIFIPQYSYVASAVITGVSEGVIFVIMLLLLLRKNI